MKAVVIHEYGGPEVLKYEDIPRPEPKDDQLLIRVIAAGVNPVDGMIRSGMFAKEGNRAFPIILGGDVAGVVEKVGSKITKFKAGDPVFAYVSLDNSGGYAQYAVVTEREAAPKPKSLTYVEAAAVPIVAIDCVAGVNRHREAECGSDRAHTWRLRWCWIVCNSNRQGARSEGDRDGFDCESGFPETTRAQMWQSITRSKNSRMSLKMLM